MRLVTLSALVASVASVASVACVASVAAVAAVGAACGGKVGPDAERVATHTAGSPGDAPPPPSDDGVLDATVPPPPFGFDAAPPPNDPTCPPAKVDTFACPAVGWPEHCHYRAPARDAAPDTLCDWDCTCAPVTPESEIAWRCYGEMNCSD